MTIVNHCKRNKMKRLLASCILFTSFLINAQEPSGCAHHDYRENQKVYSWKFNGAKMLSKPVISSPTLKIISEGELVTVLESIDTYSAQNTCFKDTILRDPLIVIESPFIKVKYGEDIGYVLEHYLNASKPIDIEKLINSGNLLHNSRLVWPGDYSSGETSTQVYDNGVIGKTFFGGKVSHEESFLIPHIASKTQFYLIALRLLAKYRSDANEGVHFETDGSYFFWVLTDPSGENPGDHSIHISMTPYGMVYSHEETGC